jgi:hypothetical protein
MALPQEDWLHLAKRLPIGQSTRHHHGRERRPNLTVGNAGDRYWAYCNACKQGGVVQKEHVIITGRQAPRESCDLTLPFDMRRILECDEPVRNGVLAVLANKNMDAQYLPELWFSKSRCRILFCHDGQWLGRDTTEASPQKWLTYNGSDHLAPTHGKMGRVAIVVEDPFSFYKVDWAVGVEYDVFTSLGTKISDALMVKLLQYDKVFMFYDGDEAGYKGANVGAKRLRSCGVEASESCAPQGLDPKDMTIHAIREYL